MAVAASLLTQDGSTVDGTAFTTASVTSTAGRTLLLAVAGGHGSGTASNVEPSSITGHGTWTKLGTVVLDYVRASLWVATATGATEPVSITYPSNLHACHWHLLELGGADAPGAVAPYSGTDQNPRWSLAAAPAAGSVTLQVAVMNSNTASFSPQGGFAAVGSQMSTDATNMRSVVQIADPGVQAVGFDTTAAAPRKVGLAVEIPAAATEPTVSAWVKHAGTRRPLLARTHTYLPAAAPTDPLAGWALHYSTDFSDLAGWDVKDGQTQNNDNSTNIAANAVPGSVSGGTGLTIYGRRESGWSTPYTSAELYGTGPMVVPNYFRAEVVGTIMDVSGLWPCLLWFRPQSGGDGSNGEIDVMEYMGGRSENLTRKRVAVTQHNEYGATQDSIKKPIYYDQLTDPSTTSLHRYTIEKTPGQIVIWIDDDTHQSRTFSAADKTWWDRIMEAPDRTWYPRITLQIGTGASTAVVPEPPAGWTESAMTVHSLKMWTMA